MSLSTAIAIAIGATPCSQVVAGGGGGGGLPEGQGFVDFSGESPGADAVPTGWTLYRQQGFTPGVTAADSTTEGSEWGLTEDFGGKGGVDLFIANDQGRQVGALLWTAIDAFADGEFVALWRFPAGIGGGGFSTPGLGILFRAQPAGTPGAEPAAATCAGLGLGFREGSAHLEIMTTGTWNFPSSAKDTVNLRVNAATHGFTGGERVWTRCNFDGERIRFRYWLEGEAEPETWAIDWTETGLDVSAGILGFGGSSGESAASADDAWILECVGYSDDPDVPAPTSANG